MPISARPGQDPGSPSAEPLSVSSRASGPALWIVRHGQSTWNIAGLAQGHDDRAELTDRGLAQAAEAAGRFRDRAVRAIYSSDLRRARQTAEAFGQVLGLPVHADARLRERSLGVLEGTPSAGIGPDVLGFADGRVTDPDSKPYGGESLRDLYTRAAAFCDALADLVTNSHDDRHSVYNGWTESDGDVVIIAHGGTLRVLAAYLHGLSVDDMAWGPVENATVVHVPDFSAALLRT